jgi:hypothetical protein
MTEEYEIVVDGAPIRVQSFNTPPSTSGGRAMAGDLAEWLLGHLADEEQRQDPLGAWNFPFSWAERESKRRIIELHAVDTYPFGDIPTGGPYDPALCQTCENEAVPCRTLRLLALPYADREGYREAWRP